MNKIKRHKHYIEYHVYNYLDENSIKYLDENSIKINDPIRSHCIASIFVGIILFLFYRAREIDYLFRLLK